jgi:hypothetical protein
MKKLITVMLAFVIVATCIVSTASATQGDPIVTIELEDTAYVRTPTQNVTNPGDPIASWSATVENVSGARSVSISKDITAKIGKSWSTTFNTSKIFSDDHNAFKVVVSNVSGSRYKVLVANNNGWAYESPESTSGCTVTVSNVSGSDTYTVYVQNVGTGTLSAHVKISSYYNS